MIVEQEGRTMNERRYDFEELYQALSEAENPQPPEYFLQNWPNIEVHERLVYHDPGDSSGGYVDWHTWYDRMQGTRWRVTWPDDIEDPRLDWQAKYERLPEGTIESG